MERECRSAASAPPPERLSPVALAHLSDLHFGAEDPALVAGLLTELTGLAPDLVVVSGDLTQRARRSQFRAARAFLDALPAPWLAVPGNHDIPGYDLVRRVLVPRARFRHFITREEAPLRVLAGARLLGLDSTRRRVTGRLSPRRLEALARLSEGAPGDLRVLVTHHPLVETQLAGTPAALEAAVGAHVDVALAGHTHLSSRRRIERDPGLGLLLVNAGTATSMRRRKKEPSNGFNVLRWDGRGRLEVELRRWDGGGYARAATEAFERTPEGWRAVPSRQGARLD